MGNEWKPVPRLLIEQGATHIYKAKVVNIVDGDTVDCDIDLGFCVHMTERVRLFGIDTPESRTRNLKEKELGLKSKARLTELCSLNGGVIHLQTAIDGDEKGKFGRILGDIWIKYLGELTNVNELLCLEGHARKYMGGKKEPWVIEEPEPAPEPKPKRKPRAKKVVKEVKEEAPKKKRTYRRKKKTEADLVELRGGQ
tara:strand:- start:3069 stop:3659 length:591 start_codon:yes stop_codon:yes gene_type:complete